MPTPQQWEGNLALDRAAPSPILPEHFHGWGIHSFPPPGHGVIGRIVNLLGAGASYSARCPWRGEYSGLQNRDLTCVLGFPSAERSCCAFLVVKGWAGLGLWLHTVWEAHIKAWKLGIVPGSHRLDMIEAWFLRSDWRNSNLKRKCQQTSHRLLSPSDSGNCVWRFTVLLIFTPVWAYISISTLCFLWGRECFSV